jgi:uncharacterized membrane protein
VSWLLTLSYVVHVAAAAFWTGAILFYAYLVVPAGGRSWLDRAAMNVLLDRLLRVTRWTGIALPVTGFYQWWVLYPVDPGALLGTTRGWLVLAMLSLWGALNGLLEVGIYRMRTVEDTVDPVAYLAEGFLVDGGVDGVDTERLAAVGRPYVLVSLALTVGLLVDAALLAGGVPL